MEHGSKHSETEQDVERERERPREREFCYFVAMKEMVSFSSPASHTANENNKYSQTDTRSFNKCANSE